MANRQTYLISDPNTIRDIYEILRLPLLLAVIAIAGTWVVWYFTSASCSDDLATITGCNPSGIANFISLDALNKIMTHAVIAGSGGGIWSYVMTTRQRRVIEALEHQLAEEREKAAEERGKAAEERERFMAILTEERQKAAEERMKASEEREKAAEEREKAADERRQLLDLVERYREQQNGSSEAHEQE